MISEDGPFGVKAVSDRIVDFAIAVSGNDTSKLGELKAAIDKGFEKARDAFGGTLPDICNRTYDEAMRKLDEWAGAGQTESIDHSDVRFSKRLLGKYPSSFSYCVILWYIGYCP